MIKLLLGLWKRISEKPSLYVVFVPWDRLSDKDAVRKLAPLLMSSLRGRFPFVIIERWRAHLSEFSPGPLEDGYRTIGLFAHPNGRGFAVNSDKPDWVLLWRWWRNESNDPPYHLLYAHVCSGSSVLVDRAWHSVFPAWISYSHGIGIFLDTPAARKRWLPCLASILKVVENAKHVGSAREQVAEIYRRHLSEALQRSDDCPSDLINSALLEDALQALTCSEP